MNDAPVSAATAAPRSGSRPLITTRAPSFASATAIARPMLLVAPVTSAVLPSSLWTMGSKMNSTRLDCAVQTLP